MRHSRTGSFESSRRSQQSSGRPRPSSKDHSLYEETLVQNRRRSVGKEGIDNLAETAAKLRQDVEEKSYINHKFLEKLERREEEYKKYIDELEVQCTESSFRMKNLAEKKVLLQKALMPLKEEANEKNAKVKELEKRLSRSLHSFGKRLETDEEIQSLQIDNDNLLKKVDNMDRAIQESQAKAKDLEERSNHCLVHTEELKKELTHKDAEILYMEGEYSAMSKKMDEKRSLIQALQANSAQLNTQKKQLAIEVEHTRIENEDYVTKFNHMQEVNKEKISAQEKIVELIEIEMGYRFKTLAARILGKRLNVLFLKEKKLSFGKMNLFVYKSGRKAQSAISFSKCMERIVSQHKGWAFQVLRNKTLNWTKCHQINEALSESLWKDRMKREAYIDWREEFDFVLQDNLRLTMAARTVADLAVKREKAVLKQKLSQWHKQAHFQRRIRVFMRHLLWRQYIKNIRTAFNSWVFTSIQEERELLKESYQEELFNTKIVHCTFSQWKRYKDIRKKVRVFRYRILFAAWKRWFEEQSNINRLDKFFGIKNQAQQRLKLHSIWANWKHETMKNKINRNKETLQKLSEQNREVITQYIDITRKATLDNKRKSAQILTALLTSKPRRALFRWKAFAAYKTTIFRNAVNRWYLNHKQSILHDFIAWRIWTMRQKDLSLHMDIQKQKEENMALVRTLEAHQRHFEELQTQNKNLRIAKLGNLLKYVDTRLLQRGFNTYRGNCRKIVKQEERLTNIFAVMNLYFKRIGFFRVKDFSRIRLASQLQEQRVLKIQRRRNEKTMRKYVEGWKAYSCIQKRIKSILDKVNLKIDYYLLRKRFNRWRKGLLKEREISFQERNYQLDIEITNLNGNIEKVKSNNEELRQQIENNSELLKRIGSRIGNYLYIKDVHRIQKEHLDKWRRRASLISRVEKSYHRIGEIFSRKNKRAGFVKISHTVYMRNLVSLHNEIYKMTEQKKQLRLDLNAMIESNTEQVETNQNKIKTLEHEIEVLIRTRENLLENFLKRKEAKELQADAQYCFFTWKRIYKAKKASLKKFEGFWWRYNVKRLFVNVRQTMREERLSILHQRLQRKVILQWQNKGVLAALRTWKSQGLAHIGIKELERNKLLEEELNRKKELLSNYIQRNVNNLDSRRKRVLLDSAFSGWKTKWETKKNLHKKCNSLKQKFELETKSKVMHSIKDLIEYKKRLQKLEERLRKFANKDLVQRPFKVLSEFMKVPKILARKLNLFIGRVKLNWKREAFEKIVEYKVAKECLMKTKLRSMCRIIENCWHISNRIWTIKGFAEIQRVADHRVLKGKIFARKMAILQKLIQRKAFETILFHSKIVRVIKKNKKSGPQALENRKLASEVKTLRKFLDKEGYETTEVDKYVQKKETQRFGKLKLMFCLLNTQASDKFIVPKCFMLWKKTTTQNKKLKKVGRLLENVVNKPELYHYFKRLKEYTNQVYQAPKAEMLQILKDQTHEIKTLAAQQAEAEQTIQDLGIVGNHYGSFQPGIKKMALRTLRRAFNKTMEGYMERWKGFVAKCQEKDFERLMKGANKKIVELENTILAKRDQNRMLEQENKNIRDVCFEGTKTAKELKVLLEERDQLTLSLTDKVAYIQELLQDNSNLAKRIATAQQEAMQLLALTKQFTGEENGQSRT